MSAFEAKDFAPHTGIFSTRYMLEYLSTHGRLDVARKIVLHRGFPGWLHMLDNGATTLWETWKESDNVYSNCHPMFGSVDERPDLPFPRVSGLGRRAVDRSVKARIFRAALSPRS